MPKKGIEAWNAIIFAYARGGFILFHSNEEEGWNNVCKEDHEDRGGAKAPGFRMGELNGNLQAFLTEDKSSSYYEVVLQMLDQLYQVMKPDRHEPGPSCSFCDIEQKREN